MKFTEQELNSFIDLYKKEFGDELNREEAQQKATALVSIIKLTYEPMTYEEFDEHMSACKKRLMC